MMIDRVTCSIPRLDCSQANILVSECWKLITVQAAKLILPVALTPVRIDKVGSHPPSTPRPPPPLPPFQIFTIDIILAALVVNEQVYRCQKIISEWKRCYTELKYFRKLASDRLVDVL